MEAFFPSVPKYDVDELPVDVYSAPHPQSVRTRSGSSLKDILALTFLWLVSAALQAGVDCQKIRLIVHLLSTFTIIDYLQELGRGGRDGKPFASILLYSSVQIGQMKKDDTLRKGPPNPLIKYLNTANLPPSVSIRLLWHPRSAPIQGASMLWQLSLRLWLRM